MRCSTALWIGLAALPACERGSPASGATRLVDLEAGETGAPSSPTGSPARPVAAVSQAVTLDAASLAVLREALASKDYATRLVAVEGLGDTKLDGGLPWLEHTLGDPEHDVRMAAVEALGKSRSPRALAILVTVRDDKTEELDVRALAASALLKATP